MSIENRYLLYRSRVVVLLLAVLTLVHPATEGQVVDGAVSGTVSDESGAILPAARIVIKNLETGASRELVTDGVGRYSAPSLAIA